jgi:hypothetical protein
MSAAQAAWPRNGAPSPAPSSSLSSSSSSSSSSSHVPQHAPTQGAGPAAVQAQQGRQPWSLLSALSISMYQSLSFSRSPSFERTRYIVSTCTFIAIIYLRTLHCLFFGTGALSCAVLGESPPLLYLCLRRCFGKKKQEGMKNIKGGRTSLLHRSYWVAHTHASSITDHYRLV